MAHKVLITDVENGEVLLDCVSSGYIYAIADDEEEGIRAANYFDDISALEVAQFMHAAESVIEEIRERNPGIAETEKLLKAVLESGLVKRESRDVEGSCEEDESNE